MTGINELWHAAFECM